MRAVGFAPLARAQLARLIFHGRANDAVVVAALETFLDGPLKFKALVVSDGPAKPRLQLALLAPEGPEHVCPPLLDEVYPHRLTCSSRCDLCAVVMSDWHSLQVAYLGSSVAGVFRSFDRQSTGVLPRPKTVLK
jgi:hypothetical protein